MDLMESLLILFLPEQPEITSGQRSAVGDGTKVDLLPEQNWTGDGLRIKDLDRHVGAPGVDPRETEQNRTRDQSVKSPKTCVQTDFGSSSSTQKRRSG